MAKYHKKNECKMCKVVHDRLGNKAGCTHLCHTPSPKPCCDSCRSKTIPYKCYAEDCKNCHQAKHEGKILEPNECAKCGLVDHTHPNKFCDSFVSEAQVSKEKDLLFIVPPIYPPEGKCKDCQFEGNDHSFECPQYVEKDPPEVSPEKKEGLNRISGEAAFELGFKQGQESIMKSGASVGKPKEVKECTCYGLVGTKKHAKECELSAELCECGKKIPEAYVQQSMIKFCSVDCLVKHFPPEVSPAKEEKEVCTCASFFTVRGVHKKDCPTLIEQKGEWEEEFDEFLDEKDKTGGATIPELKSFIAAKLAQKEQAVKAEIRDEVKMRRKLVWNWQKETKELDAFNQAIDEILSLLSDKVNH